MSREWLKKGKNMLKKKGSTVCMYFPFFEPLIRLELTTCALRMRCSTD